jgi:nucleoid DNA-binding protein
MSGMTKYNQREDRIAEEALGVDIVNHLMKGVHIIIPDFGYLELKSLADKQTVLFKNGDRIPDKLAGEENDSLQSAINEIISVPLKEGKVVSLSKLGVFRPIKAAEGLRLSFTPSLSLRKRLNGEEEITEVIVNEIAASSDEAVDKNLIEEKNAPTPKSKTDTGRKIAQVGDVIIPQDDISSVSSRKKKANIAGWMLVSVAILVVLYIIVTSILPHDKNTIEDRPLPVATQQSAKVNLPALAEQHYGNPIFWVYIYEANQDKLSSPMNIPKGISLIIPNLEEEYAVDISDSIEIKRAYVRAELILKQLK